MYVDYVTGGFAEKKIHRQESPRWALHRHTVSPRRNFAVGSLLLGRFHAVKVSPQGSFGKFRFRKFHCMEVSSYGSFGAWTFRTMEMFPAGSCTARKSCCGKFCRVARNNIINKIGMHQLPECDSCLNNCVLTAFDFYLLLL